MTNVIETVDLSRTFGGLVANQQISLGVKAGEIRGIIGPNGAGKTTLLNVISGVYPVTKGDVKFLGNSIVGLKLHEINARGLLRTFQIPRVFGDMTVAENLLVGALPHYKRGDPIGRHKAKSQAEYLLSLTGLTPLAGQPAKHLSGGQSALLQLATGFMVPNLTCYLLDECFAGINPLLQETMIDLILRARADQGTCFLVVSHEMKTLRRLCDSVSVMVDGRIIAEGSWADVSSDPKVINSYLGQGAS